MASFTFGYTDENNQGTTVPADDLLDVAQWWTDSCSMEPSVIMYSTITEKLVQVKTVWPDRFWMKKWSGWTIFGQLKMVRPDRFW